MQLHELISVLKPIEVIGSVDKPVHGLHFDSRKIEKDDVFVAQVGTAVDGHTFIDGCVARGCAAVVLSDKRYLPDNGQWTMDNGQNTTFILVENTDEALGLLASRWFGEPSKELTLVGGTGTNGVNFAATELADFLGRMSGARFLVASKPVPGYRTILVGTPYKGSARDDSASASATRTHWKLRA